MSTALTIAAWVVVRVAFMGYQLVIAAVDIVQEGFRGSISLGGADRERMGR
jgi:hypothetical protein